MRKIRIVTTQDGSCTLFDDELNETYHSTNGARTESEHVFIQAGLEQCSEKVDILEVGLGTGLNAWLTAQDTRRKITYTALEPYPQPEDIIREYGSMNGMYLDNDLYRMIHSSAWDRRVELTESFSILKLCRTLEMYEPGEDRFDLIYMDAFSPEVQPELWEESIFEKLYGCLREGGILVTYCAKGVVKRRMRGVGFRVEGLSGPPGKREMTRGIRDFDPKYREA
jgi:tRNA U34 5-methylaminomethyl-2-thiouridine-forming methyltransferase MnmC